MISYRREGFYSASIASPSELLLGGTLRAALEEGPLPVRRAPEAAEQIARSLDLLEGLR